MEQTEQISPDTKKKPAPSPKPKAKAAAEGEEVERSVSKLTIVGAPGIELSVSIEYVNNIAFINEVATLSKDYKAIKMGEVINSLKKDIKYLQSSIREKGGYVTRVAVKKVVIKGFSDGCATFMHERAMMMMSGLIYLLALEPPPTQTRA